MKHATSEATARFRGRFQGRAADGHFRLRQNLWLSSFGIGTYLGPPEEETDEAYAESVVEAVKGGLNVIDTAINYRFQRSERAVGEALRRLEGRGCAREEILVCTKAGYLTPDGAMPADPAGYFEQEYLRPGILARVDVVAGIHCMTPRFLGNQLGRSLGNLALECVDVYYLHNPETQLSEVSREAFRDRLRKAFRFLESCADEGGIRFYGLATWTGLRQDPAAQDYLSLEDCVGLAREAAGGDSRFRFVQLPFNLALPEAEIRRNQKVKGKFRTPFEAAQDLELTTVVSAPLLQGRLCRAMPEVMSGTGGIEDSCLQALQFARSVPGAGTTLVGMSRVEHVRSNLRLAGIEPLDPERIRSLLRS